MSFPGRQIPTVRVCVWNNILTLAALLMATIFSAPWKQTFYGSGASGSSHVNYNRHMTALSIVKAGEFLLSALQSYRRKKKKIASTNARLGVKTSSKLILALQRMYILWGVRVNFYSVLGSQISYNNLPRQLVLSGSQKTRQEKRSAKLSQSIKKVCVYFYHSYPSTSKYTLVTASQEKYGQRWLWQTMF